MKQISPSTVQVEALFVDRGEAEQAQTMGLDFDFEENGVYRPLYLKRRLLSTINPLWDEEGLPIKGEYILGLLDGREMTCKGEFKDALQVFASGE